MCWALGSFCVLASLEYSLCFKGLWNKDLRNGKITSLKYLLWLYRKVCKLLPYKMIVKFIWKSKQMRIGRPFLKRVKGNGELALPITKKHWTFKNVILEWAGNDTSLEQLISQIVDSGACLGFNVILL